MIILDFDAVSIQNMNSTKPIPWLFQYSVLAHVNFLKYSTQIIFDF